MTNMNGISGGFIQGGHTVNKADVAKPELPKLTQTTTKTSAPTQDAASLSGTGSLLAAATTRTGDIRADKVESLRAAIHNGTYNVPAGEVADKLLKNMLE